MSSTMFDKPLDTEFVGKLNGVDERLDELSEQIGTIDTKLSNNTTGTITTQTASFSISDSSCIKTGNVVTISLAGTASTMGGQVAFAQISNGYRPRKNIYTRLYCNYAGTVGFYDARIDTDGYIRTNIGGGTVNGEVTLLPVSYGIL